VNGNELIEMGRIWYEKFIPAHLYFLLDNACFIIDLGTGCIWSDQAFPIAAARTWNSLPSEVTSSQCLPTFKTKLKTRLFSASFPQLTVK